MVLISNTFFPNLANGCNVFFNMIYYLALFNTEMYIIFSIADMLLTTYLDIFFYTFPNFYHTCHQHGKRGQSMV